MSCTTPQNTYLYVNSTKHISHNIEVCVLWSCACGCPINSTKPTSCTTLHNTYLTKIHWAAAGRGLSFMVFPASVCVSLSLALESFAYYSRSLLATTDCAAGRWNPSSLTRAHRLAHRATIRSVAFYSWNPSSLAPVRLVGRTHDLLVLVRTHFPSVLFCHGGSRPESLDHGEYLL